jgi:hypothetical protein
MTAFSNGDHWVPGTPARIRGKMANYIICDDISKWEPPTSMIEAVLPKEKGGWIEWTIIRPEYEIRPEDIKDESDE